MDVISYLRQFRINKIALFDLVISYVGMYLLAPSLSKIFNKLSVSVTRAQWLWLTIPIGVLFHLVFNQQTALNKMLFSTAGNIAVKFAVLFMLYMGLLGARKRD